jgi:hypothetical protein
MNLKTPNKMKTVTKSPKWAKMPSGSIAEAVVKNAMTDHRIATKKEDSTSKLISKINRNIAENKQRSKQTKK